MIRTNCSYFRQEEMTRKVGKGERGKLVKASNKYYHLQSGHVLFPEQVFAKAVAERRKKVVKVHDKVDERVDHWAESSETARHEFGSEPAVDWHDH
jgi:hypothetical protein